MRQPKDGGRVGASKGRWRTVAFLAVLGASAVAAASEPVVGPHPASGCVAPVEGAAAMPRYPEEAVDRGEGGRVVVDLVFSSPDGRPTVRFVTPESPDSLFDRAVSAHVRELRAACLNPEDGPLRLRREFLFRPEGGQVNWFRNDVENLAERALLRCVAHLSGDKRPPYPALAREDGVSGRVLLAARFDGPDRPPHVLVHARPGMKGLERAVRTWADGLRMPCHPGSGPVRFNAIYSFVFEGEPYGFRELDLVQLLRSTKGIRTQTLQFDTRRMQCPFEVQFHYLQPALRNRVGEIGDPVDSRKPLLDWLEGVEFDAPPRVQDALFGDSVRMLVPCVNIDLKPKE